MEVQTPVWMLERIQAQGLGSWRVLAAPMRWALLAWPLAPQWQPDPQQPELASAFHWHPLQQASRQTPRALAPASPAAAPWAAAAASAAPASSGALLARP